MPSEVIEVWRFDLDAVYETVKSFEFLDATERAKADSFVSAVHRQRFIAGRTALRALLAHAICCRPAELRIGYTDTGKPILCSGGRLTFNVSHSDSVCYIALSNNTILGIDVERERELPDLPQLASMVCSAAELEELAGLSSASTNKCFLRCWTRKEAYVKALGVGISVDLSAITVGTTDKDTDLRTDDHGVIRVRTLKEIPQDEHVAIAFPRSEGGEVSYATTNNHELLSWLFDR